MNYDEIDNPIADYSDDELQDQMDKLQAEIDRRKAQDDEITILARKVCADICNRTPFTKKEYLSGYCDKTEDMRLAKAAIIAGMELERTCSMTFNDDFEAHEFLMSRGFSMIENGVYVPPKTGYKLTSDEGAAIDHLCDEWDCVYCPDLLQKGRES